MTKSKRTSVSKKILGVSDHRFKKALQPKKLKTLDPAKDFDKPVRQPRLPEMQDPILEDLESLAQEYVHHRDKRLASLKQEVPLRDALLNAMKKNGKTTYRRDGIFIAVIPEKEKVKVKITGGGDGEEPEEE